MNAHQRKKMRRMLNKPILKGPGDFTGLELRVLASMQADIETPMMPALPPPTHTEWPMNASWARRLADAGAHLGLVAIPAPLREGEEPIEGVEPKMLHVRMPVAIELLYFHQNRDVALLVDLLPKLADLAAVDVELKIADVSAALERPATPKIDLDRDTVKAVAWISMYGSSSKYGATSLTRDPGLKAMADERRALNHRSQLDKHGRFQPHGPRTLGRKGRR